MSQELFDKLRSDCDKLKKVKEAKAKLSAAEKELSKQSELLVLSIHTLMDALHLKKQHYPEIGAFTKEFRLSPKIVERDLFVKYLQEAGDEGIMSVLPQVLASYVKKDLPENVDPEKIGLSVFMKPVISIRKA